LRADIDTITGGFNRSHLDPVGFQGQTGNYTDTETLHAAAGLYAALSGPGGIYYSPESGVGMARSRADALNTYDQLLHPFDGWTFGAYAHEAGQFGIGEAKGTLNFVAGTAVSLSPELMLLDEQTGGRLSEPIATTGTQAAGSGFIQPVLFVATFFVDPEEVVALGGKGAKVLGRLAPGGKRCFVAGTPVQMADGTTEPIEQVREGDLVKSRNPRTGQTEAKRVDRTYVRVAPQVVTLTFMDGNTHQTQAFTCTPEHPFYVDGRGFVQAGDLGIGTSIVTRAGPALTLSAASWSALPAPATGLALGGGQSSGSAQGYRVYNLRVEDDHSYFVGTAHGGTCVHNADYPIVLKAYGPLGVDLKGTGTTEAGHHVIQDAAVRELPGYDPDEAIATPLTGKRSQRGTPHGMTRGVQRNPIYGDGTYAGERRVGYRALRAAGVSRANARAAIRKADDYFHSIGVNGSTPTRIPLDRR